MSLALNYMIYTLIQLSCWPVVSLSLLLIISTECLLIFGSLVLQYTTQILQKTLWFSCCKHHLLNCHFHRTLCGTFSTTKDEGINGAPNSANTYLCCCTYIFILWWLTSGTCVVSFTISNVSIILFKLILKLPVENFSTRLLRFSLNSCSDILAIWEVVVVILFLILLL